jgi:acylphosphatase
VKGDSARGAPRPGEEEVERLTARVRGRVQGVGFRFWVRDEAERLGVTGWVMNEDDERTVAILAEGPRRALDELQRLLSVGPRSARVDWIETAREPASGAFDRFEITRP